MKVAAIDDWEGLAELLREDPNLPDSVTVQTFQDHLSDPDLVVERLAPFEAVLAMRERTPFGRSVLSRLPNLKLLVTTGLINRSIDLAAASELGVMVCGAPGAGAGVVEHTWALILSLARQIPDGDRAVRSGTWLPAEVGVYLEGRTLGVVGLGRVGQRVAVIGRAFGMEVLAWSPTLDEARAAKSGAKATDLVALLGSSDFVTIHLPLVPGTEKFVDNRFLALMKPDAFLVNTSRGGVVDQRDLVAALEAGNLRGAGLDVFEVEPAPSDDPILRAPGLNVFSPHRGYVVDTTMTAFRQNQALVLAAYLAGQPINVLTS